MNPPLPFVDKDFLHTTVWFKVGLFYQQNQSECNCHLNQSSHDWGKGECKILSYYILSIYVMITSFVQRIWICLFKNCKISKVKKGSRHCILKETYLTEIMWFSNSHKLKLKMAKHSCFADSHVTIITPWNVYKILSHPK